MLCFEGIALMLNIFRGKKPIPNYRLVAPPNGELQTITVHEEVRWSGSPRWLVSLIDALDVEDTAICLWRRVAKHHFHPREI